MKRHTFQVGDDIRCIDADGAPALGVGHVYKVRKAVWMRSPGGMLKTTSGVLLKEVVMPLELDETGYATHEPPFAAHRFKRHK